MSSLFLKIIGYFCNNPTTHQSHTLVGAGIARPTYADDSVKSQAIVPADMGRAMPAPTRVWDCV
ncbi:MAG: hypothetical protein FWD97_08910 [Defluviitaleaceae bacterium]|nr:hypothetical protein [Defluviitaleaceae bacterium]